MIRSRQAFAATSIALACAAFCSVASAQSSVSIYGLINMDAGRFQLAGNPSTYHVDSGNMSTSFIGFKGSEDLGGGFKAVFALESFLRADNGNSGRFNGDAMWARSSYVGIGSNYGAVTMGRTSTPMFVSTLVLNAFGDSFGYSPSIRQWFGNRGALLGDSGWNNSITYSSPKVSGAILTLSGNLGEATSGAQGKNFGGNVIYYGGPLTASIAAQQTRNNSLAGWNTAVDKQNAWQLGVAYDFGVVKPYAQYGQVKTDFYTAADTKATIWGLGVAIPLGGGRVLAQYGDSKLDTTSAKSRIATIGYDYSLSKRTDVYVVGMNDRYTGLSKGNSLMAGIRHTF